MADTFYYSRDTKVHLTDSAGAIYKIPVLDGFSFSQATNATEVTLNEMTNAAGVSRRARQMFTDSYAPAEWSFQTYIRPFKSGGGGSGEHGAVAHHMVEEPLWNALAGSGAVGASGTALTADGTDANIAFTNSNKVALDTFDLFFEMGTGKANPTIYKIEGCVVNEVSIDFDIDGIATANWSGMGSIITDVASMTTATIVEGTASADTNNFIRNRLTDLTVTNDVTTATVNGATSSTVTVVLDSGSYPLIKAGQVIKGSGVTAGTTVSAIVNNTITLSAAMSIPDDTVLTFSNAGMTDTYSLTLTGGNVTISNNMTFLTPETLGSVNQPLGHVTGTRSVSGTFTCYLNTPSSGASSADLFEDIIEATSVITNSFNLKFIVGGTGGDPRMEMNMSNCHLEVPTHSIDDIISLETSFHALPTSIDAVDELDLTFVGPVVE